MVCLYTSVLFLRRKLRLDELRVVVVINTIDALSLLEIVFQMRQHEQPRGRSEYNYFFHTVIGKTKSIS